MTSTHAPFFQVPYGAAVTDVAFLADGYRLAVAVRGSNYLRLVDCRALLEAAAAAVRGRGRLEGRHFCAHHVYGSE